MKIRKICFPNFSIYHHYYYYCLLLLFQKLVTPNLYHAGEAGQDLEEPFGVL